MRTAFMRRYPSLVAGVNMGYLELLPMMRIKRLSSHRGNDEIRRSLEAY
jgi:hypothetical protein